jgi:TRAP transporter TAXI family solute receptor
MCGSRITIIVAFIFLGFLNFCYAFELPKNPFAKESQATAAPAPATNTTSLPQNVPSKPAVPKNMTITTDKSVSKKNGVKIRNITIATTSSSGSVGDAICSMINYNQEKIGFNCSIKEFSGAVGNMSALSNGNVDFAIIPANIVYEQLQKSADANPAQNVAAKNANIAEPNFVLALYSAKLNALVKEDSNIKNIDDIKGRIIDVSSVDSSANQILQAISKAKNWDINSLSSIEYIQSKDKANALCAKQIDVSLNYVGTPNNTINRITESCQVRILPIDDNLVAQLASSDQFISKDTIPGGKYLGNPMDVNTFGSPLIIVTTKDFDKQLVYNLVKLLMQNMGILSKIHPAFKVYPLSDFANNKGLIPYHEGAAMLFREKGLLSK